MEQANRLFRIGLISAVLLEMVLLAVAAVLLDWRDRTQVLLLLFSILGYSIVASGMVALAGHVTRVGARILAVLDDSEPR